ncbi:MAG TPA: Gfo/Idh/MocA family oxidoreductase [Chloroflexota bacterium]|nr:Gfo/Idh/MocA family oxidoreductase [Chloroflexota bacterium]
MRVEDLLPRRSKKSLQIPSDIIAFGGDTQFGRLERDLVDWVGGEDIVTRLRVGIVGAGRRVDYLYCPLVKLMTDDLELVGIYSRSLESARLVGEKYRCPQFDDLDRFVETTRPDLLVVSVSSRAYGEVARSVVNYGIPMLIETPIAQDLEDADAIIATGRKKRAPIEVAEQYFRRPMERIKTEVLRAGHFGTVNVAYNDCMGHAYHGISLIRSYIGFDVPATRVSATIHSFGVQLHSSSASGLDVESEQWEHAVITFANGARGVFDWTSIGYGSAIRWQRSTHFLATKGMALGGELTLLSKDGKAAAPIWIERRIHNIGGMEVLSEVVAHTDPPIHWVNPFSRYLMDDELIAEAAGLQSLIDAIRTGQPPEYGPVNARVDQAIYLAMKRSAALDGAPVDIE